MEDQQISLVERLRSNDSTLKELRLTEAPITYSTTIQELLDALRANTVINYVRIDRDFLPCMLGGATEVNAFFAALGEIPSLKEVHIWHAAFAVSALLGFLNPTKVSVPNIATDEDGKSALNPSKKQLTVLELGCLELSGTTEEFQQVAGSLQFHPTLRIFRMVDFSFTSTDGTERTYKSLDPFLSSLSVLPQLEIFKIEVTARRRQSLCGAEKASILPNVGLSGTALAKLISTSTSIQEIHLTRIPLKLQDYVSIADAVSKSVCKVRVLALINCDVSDNACDVLCPALATNCTIKTLDLSCNSITDEGCICIASSLKTNTSVKMLRLWGNVKITTAGFDALSDMLEVNCHLERVPLMTSIQ